MSGNITSGKKHWTHRRGKKQKQIHDGDDIVTNRVNMRYAVRLQAKGIAGSAGLNAEDVYGLLIEVALMDFDVLEKVKKLHAVDRQLDAAYAQQEKVGTPKATIKQLRAA